MVRDTGPPTSPDFPDRAMRRAISKSTPRRNRGVTFSSRFLRDARVAGLLLLRSGTSIAVRFVLRASERASERYSEMPITGIALRGIWGQRTFVTAATVIIGTVDGRHVSEISPSNVCDIHQ